MKFHDVIYLATDNQKLIQLLNNLREQMYRYRVEYLKRSDFISSSWTSTRRSSRPSREGRRTRPSRWCASMWTTRWRP